MPKKTLNLFLNGIIRSRFSGYYLSLCFGHPVQFVFALQMYGDSDYKNWGKKLLSLTTFIVKNSYIAYLKLSNNEKIITRSSYATVA